MHIINEFSFDKFLEKKNFYLDSFLPKQMNIDNFRNNNDDIQVSTIHTNEENEEKNKAFIYFSSLINADQYIFNLISKKIFNYFYDNNNLELFSLLKSFILDRFDKIEDICNPFLLTKKDDEKLTLGDKYCLLYLLYCSYHHSKRNYVFQDLFNKILDDATKKNFKINNYLIASICRVTGNYKKAKIYYIKSFLSSFDIFILWKLTHVLQAENKLNFALQFIKVLSFITGITSLDSPILQRYFWITKWIGINKKFIRYVDHIKNDTKPIRINKKFFIFNLFKFNSVNLSNNDFLISFELTKKQISKNQNIFYDLVNQKLHIYTENKKLFIKIIDNLLNENLKILQFDNKSKFFIIKIKKNVNNIYISINNNVHKFYEEDLVDNLDFGCSHYLLQSVLKFDLQIKNANLPISSNKNVIIFTTYYGDLFSYLFENSLLISFLNSGELNKLKKTHNISWRIYSTIEQKTSLEKIKIKIKKYFDISDVQINYTLLKNENSNPRNNLNLTVQDVTRSALQNNSFIIFAPPDHIFGHGLCSLVNKIVPGDYYVCGHPRISLKKTISNMQHILELIKNDYDNKKLVNATMFDYPHQIVQTGLKNYSNVASWWRAELNQLDFLLFKFILKNLHLYYFFHHKILLIN